MKQLRIPAAFIRGGTSNAVVFNQEHLPKDRALWDDIFMAVIGSPDPYGRQLDGMGGGFGRGGGGLGQVAHLTSSTACRPPAGSPADRRGVRVRVGVARAWPGVDTTIPGAPGEDAIPDEQGDTGEGTPGEAPDRRPAAEKAEELIDFAFQAVHMIADGDFIGPWKDGDPRTSRIVFIGRNLNRPQLRRGFESCQVL